MAKFERPTQTPVAPLRRKSTGAYMPKNLWRLNAEKSLAPLCRKRFGSLTTKVHILDDWGMGAIDSMTRSDLLEVVDDRAGRKATIITSQLPIEHWHAWIGDATIADAMLDRLMQHHHRITLTGDSLRSRKAQPAQGSEAGIAAPIVVGTRG